MTRYAICLGLLATAILLPAPVLAQGRGHAGSNGHRAGGHQAQKGMGMMPYGGMGTMPYSSTGMMPYGGMGMNTNPWSGGFQPKSARKQGIPPGLARRGTLPPGLARRQGVGATGSPSNVGGGAINNATGTSPANSRPVNPAAGTSDRGATGVVPGNGAGEAQPVRAQSKSKAGRRGNAAR